VQAHPDAFTETLLAFETQGLSGNYFKVNFQDDGILPSDHAQPRKPPPPAPRAPPPATGGADGPGEEKSRRIDHQLTINGSDEKSRRSPLGDNFLGQMLRSLEDPGRLERQRFDPPANVLIN